MATCFVIQGYGKKTDYTSGRVLDLDASYEVIKEAVESAGLECIRADEIIHSGIIDVPMYLQLLNADLVIADLSSYNVNAAFELGIRYALKPHATIVMAEEHFKYPFDLNHIVIRTYQHLGEQGITFKEAKRMIKELKTAIQTILKTPVTDSPVYTFLPNLMPPLLPKLASATVLPDISALAPEDFSALAATIPSAAAKITGEDNPSAKLMLDSALDKIKASDFVSARILFEEVRKLRPHDSFVLQQLALCTYKSKQPTVVEALKAAQKILQELSPDTCNNPETLGLWGATHKRLWEECGDPRCLAISISAYERGYYIKQDHYNGVNYAYLLNLRAVESLKAGLKDDAIADYIGAKRVRHELINVIKPKLALMVDGEDKYWVIASLYEAAIGSADAQAEAEFEAKAKAMPVADWMHETRINQAAKLKALMATYSGLIGKT